ncbi:MAG TPA: hypothetical protein VKA38_00730, partial [Draconibacterium sp.]|nr:hypothetical protein [Draconibacterium sp.]
EMAEIAANVLTSEGHENKIYNISGEEAFSYADIARMISEITGKEIKFVSPPVVKFIQTLKKSGVPEESIKMSAGFAQAIEQGEFDAPNPDISKLLGRKPIPLKAFLKQVYG